MSKQRQSETWNGIIICGSDQLPSFSMQCGACWCSRLVRSIILHITHSASEVPSSESSDAELQYCSVADLQLQISGCSSPVLIRLAPDRQMKRSVYRGPDSQGISKTAAMSNVVVLVRCDLSRRSIVISAASCCSTNCTLHSHGLFPCCQQPMKSMLLPCPPYSLHRLSGGCGASSSCAVLAPVSVA